VLCLLPKAPKFQKPSFGKHVELIKKPPEIILDRFNRLIKIESNWENVTVTATPNPKKPDWTIVTVEGDPKGEQKIASKLERLILEELKRTKTPTTSKRFPCTDLIAKRNEILRRVTTATQEYFQMNPLPGEKHDLENGLTAYTDRTIFLLGHEGETELQKSKRIALLKRKYKQEALDKIVTEEGINWPSLQHIVSSLTSKKPKQKR